MSSALSRRLAAVLVASFLGGTIVASASPALALQDLGEFLDSARTKNLDNRAAQELVDQRDGEADQAWGRVLPALTARGMYTRNQYESEIQVPIPGGPPGAPPQTRTVTITPQNQLDAFFTVDVPLVDVAGWKRVAAARSLRDATQARAGLTVQEVERAVAQLYYRVVAAEALVAAAQRNVATAEKNREIVVARKAADVATQLDLERAQAEIERARQGLADADLLNATSRRALQSVTRVTPSAGGLTLEDGLQEEAPLAVWESRDVSSLPPVRAAALERRAAEHASGAAKAGFLPVISATATERLTNATGFSGNSASYTAGLAATMRLDWGTVGAVKAQGAAARVAAIREESARTTARDRIHDSWHAVRAQIAKSRAAHAQTTALARAASIARDRYRDGAGTQLELIQAERDLFGAEVQRIQADADLVLARAVLRLSAGQEISKTLQGRASTGGAAQ